MKIVFFGSTPFSIPSLKMLMQQENELAAVVTQPDRRRGRGQRVSSTPVAEQAVNAGLAVLKPQRAKEESFIAGLREISPHLLVVVAYGQILPPQVLEIPTRGSINLHASLLPRYRGAAPVEWSIIRGERITGVTTMLMDERMDTGPILMSRQMDILPGEAAGELSRRLADAGSQLLKETLKRWKEGGLNPTPQDSSAASYAPPLSREDAHIRWDRRGEEIVNLIRGANPRPGAYSFLCGAAPDQVGACRTLKIFKASFIKTQPAEAAGAIAQLGRSWLKVACGDGYVYIEEVQPENRRRMPAEAYLAGTRLKTGAVMA